MGLAGLAVAADPAARRPAPREGREQDLPFSGALANSLRQAPGPDGQIAKPLHGVRLPLEYYPDGVIKTEVQAVAASLPQTNGDVHASGVQVFMYLPDGKTLDGRIEAESCRFNKAEGRADSDGKVKASREGVVIRGQGFDWDSKDEVLTIRRDAEVLFNRRKLEKGMGKNVWKGKTQR